MSASASSCRSPSCLRYSLNQFVPGKFMVDALTVENYVKFFTDGYYTAVLWRTVRVALVTTAICLLMGFPLAYVLARTRTRHKNLLIMLVVLPLFVGNAVRAAGWMVAFGNKGLLNASLVGVGADRAAARDHVLGDGGDHRHRRRQPALHGADAAERHRGHRPRRSRRRRSTSAPTP